MAMKAYPEIIVMSGYGINCEYETAYAFDRARFSPDEIQDAEEKAAMSGQSGIKVLISRLSAREKARVVHVNDLVNEPRMLADCRVLVWPGGFSMGDDTDAGKAFAHYARDRLRDPLLEFIKGDNISIGICNGFQIMLQLGMLPIGHDRYLTDDAVQAALTFNTNARYTDRWVYLKNEDRTQKCVWAGGAQHAGQPNPLRHFKIPIAHGEGRFYADEDVMEALWGNDQVVFVYATEGGYPAEGGPANPNGSLDDIAAICDRTGRFLGMMPHPGRAILTSQDDLYTLNRELAAREGKQLPEEAACMQVFRNAVGVIKGNTYIRSGAGR